MMKGRSTKPNNRFAVRSDTRRVRARAAVCSDGGAFFAPARLASRLQADAVEIGKRGRARVQASPSDHSLDTNPGRAPC